MIFDHKYLLIRAWVLLGILGTAAFVSIMILPEHANAISISSPSDVTLSAIPGTGGTSTGSVSWTVSTVLTGYNLTVSASTTPAMKSGSNSIADYHATTPETWSTAVADSEFGFSTEGAATSTTTWGTPSTGAGKYRGFAGSTQINIASRAASLTFNDVTTVYFKIEVGSNHFQVSGTYTATITATATSLL